MGSIWDVMVRLFRIKRSTFGKVVTKVLRTIIIPIGAELIDEIQHQNTMAKLSHLTQRFKFNTKAIYATDVTFQCASKPTRNHAESKIYYSAKHKMYAYKTEVSVLPNGLAINCTDNYAGGLSDITIFRANRRFHEMATLKSDEERNMTTLNDMENENDISTWAILVDKGYQSGGDVGRILHPVKRPPNGTLCLMEKEQNLEITRDRIIVENYFGRMKTLWKIMETKYTWDEGFYDILFGICLCITNFHILKHPLREEDGKRWIQMENQMHYLSKNLRRRKAEQQATYRRRNRARLLGANVMVDNDDDSDD